MKKEYCTQNEGNCQSCGLVNYGRDCYNNLINYLECETPFEYYKRIKTEFEAMTPTQKTTEYCRLMLDLEEFDETTFMGRWKQEND